jgi:hypothetical protein
VRLGTANPQNRSSAFYDPSYWLAQGRPAPLDQATVVPGQIGRFTFKMHAPKVTAPTTFDEFFEPLWEMRNWFGWGNVWLRYTVLPAEPPKLTITSSPTKVTRGEPIAVVVDAQDNTRVTGVRVADVDATRIAGTDSYRAEVPSSSLPAGPTAITVSATDPGGRTSTAGTSVEVREPEGPKPPPAGDPAIFDARITSLFVWKGARTTFTSMRITDLPRSAKVLVTCKGKGCVAARRTIKHSGGTVNLLKKLKRVKLRSGALLQVRLTDGGATKLASWKIRTGKAPRMSFRCAPAGGKLSRCR